MTSEAHAVGEFQQLGRGRIVAGADGVHAHATFRISQLPLDGAAIDGRAQRAQVVVQADAVEAHAPCR